MSKHTDLKQEIIKLGMSQERNLPPVPEAGVIALEVLNHNDIDLETQLSSCDHNDIRGEKLVKFWKNCCNADFETFKDAVDIFIPYNADITETIINNRKAIIKNLSLDKPITLIDNKISFTTNEEYSQNIINSFFDRLNKELKNKEQNDTELENKKTTTSEHQLGK